MPWELSVTAHIPGDMSTGYKALGLEMEKAYKESPPRKEEAQVSSQSGCLQCQSWNWSRVQTEMLPHCPERLCVGGRSLVKAAEALNFSGQGL